MGILGKTIVVNGTLAPYQDVSTERVRLRLLNASNARVFQFAFDDGRSFDLVGTDGGLLPAPTVTSRVMLSPGERAEIVVTVRPGERTVLQSQPPDLGTPVISRLVGGSDAFDVLQLRAAATLAPSPSLPPRLVDVPAIDATGAAARNIELNDQAINHHQMDMSRIDLTVAPNAVEVWHVNNDDGKPHSLHIHGVSFQVSRLDNGPPPAYLSGWKDTLYVSPAHTYEIVVRFPSFVDPATPYMYHCHVLYHEDQGMMGQYVVAEPGQPPAVNPAPAHHDHH
jgi:FtsP/CotA-like multicopper oxidase with cupredoxin domain